MQSGDRFAGRYLIEAPLGQGGMGVVYRVFDERLRRKVALKVMAPELTRDPGFRARFDREASTAAAFEHDNVVQVYDYAEHDGVLYLVMRYVAGRDLRGELEIAGSFELGRTVAVVEQVAAGLDAAHAHGDVHRDVKPGNVLLERTAQGGERALVTDFGLAQPQQGGQGLTSSGKIFGTAAYMAPEQLLGERASVRSDVYALACVAFECLSGRPPFQGKTDVEIAQGHLSGRVPDLRRLVPGLPEGAALAVERGLSKQPGGRPESAGAFAGALAAGAGRPGPAPRTAELDTTFSQRADGTRSAGATGRGGRSGGAVRRPAAAAAGIAVLALAGAAVFAQASARPDPGPSGPAASPAPSDPASATPADSHQALAARLPTDVFAGCAPQPERQGEGRIAAVVCSPVTAGADELLVTQWADTATMLAAFARFHGTKPDGKCGAYDGTPQSGLRSTWGPGGKRPMACYVNDNQHAVLLWEHPDQAVQVLAVNHDRTASAALFNWWQTAAQSPIR